MARTSRQELVDKYAPEYLKDKTEEQKQAFYAKSLNNQYNNIQAWKRRGIQKASREVISAEELLNELKCAAHHIKNLQEFTDREAQKLKQEVSNLASLLDNLDEIRKDRQLKDLLEKQQEIARQIAQLNNAQ